MREIQRVLTDRETIRQALIDAISWQESFADASRGLPDGREAVALSQRYRALLQGRYGDRRTPAERALDGAKTLSLDDLRATPKREDNP